MMLANTVKDRADLEELSQRDVPRPSALNVDVVPEPMLGDLRVAHLGVRIIIVPQD